MTGAEQLNSFLVDMFGRINKIEERTMAEGLGSAVSITEIHIIEKIGAQGPVRMSEIAKSIGVTLATLTVACDKLVAKGLVRRVRSLEDRRVVNITLTAKGRAAYEYHKAFHERMIASVLDSLSPEQTAVLAQSLEKLQDFFRQEGVPLKVERGNRVFPESDRAADIIDALFHVLRRSRVRVIQDRARHILVEDGAVCGVAGRTRR